MKLKEVQDKSFDLLCLIDEICKKEHVRYYLHAGTELGSVREKDIIPWDDDVDIKVMLEDYQDFKVAMEKNLPPYVKLIEPPDFAPAFFDFMVRVLDTRYLLREETEEDRYYGNLQNHIGVDVFIQHRISASAIPRAIEFSRLLFWYGLGMGHRYKVSLDKYHGLSKIGVFILSRIGRFINPVDVWKRYYKLINRLNDSTSNRAIRNSMTLEGTVFTDWTDKAAKGILRGREFPIPIGYDAELKSYYGDYKLPPKDRNAFIQHLDIADRYKD